MIYKVPLHLEYKCSVNTYLDDIHDLHKNLGISCLVINKYKLYDYKQKSYQVSHFDKLDLNKIKEKSIIVYHSSIFRGSPEKVIELIDYCIENNKDLFIPVGFNSDLNLFVDNYTNIRIDDVKIIVRELKLKSLLM
jgi:hypothetical protein